MFRWLAVLFIVLFLLAEATLVRAAEPTKNKHTLGYSNFLQIYVSNNNQRHFPDIFWITISYNSPGNRWLVIYNGNDFSDGNPLNPQYVEYCAVVSSTSDAAIGTKSWHWTDSPLKSLYVTDRTELTAFISTSGCATLNADTTSDWITVGFGLQ